MTAWRTLLATAVLALALLAACGGGDNKPGTSVVAPSPSPIGAYEDRNEFRSFVSKVNEALDDGDLQFFLDNVSYQEVSCAEESPRPPGSCAEKPAGSTTPAILAGAWESEDFYLDPAAYESFLGDFLNNAATGESDAYGDAEARLYAYAVIRPELAFAPPAAETVQAILTRIAPDSPPRREALLLTLGFNGERWTVTQLVIGPETFLDPHGPLPPPQSGIETIFEFWSLWKPGDGE